MMNVFTVEQIAKSLRISEKSTMELLARNNIVPVNGTVPMNQTARFMQQVESDDSVCEKRSQENLERVVNRFTVVVDTCTILNDQFPVLYRRLMPMLLNYGKRLVIPTCVVTEMQHLFLTRPELREKVQSALTLLDEGERDNLVEFMGDKTDVFGDQQILSLATRLYVTEDVLLITYDHNLSRDALRLNDMASVEGYEVGVSRLNRYGFLSRYTPRTPEGEAA